MTTLTLGDYFPSFVPARLDPVKRRAVRQVVEERCKYYRLSAEQTNDCVRAALTSLDNDNSPAYSQEYGCDLAHRKHQANETLAARLR